MCHSSRIRPRRRNTVMAMVASPRTTAAIASLLTIASRLPFSTRFTAADYKTALDLPPTGFNLGFFPPSERDGHPHRSADPSREAAELPGSGLAHPPLSS